MKVAMVSRHLPDPAGTAAGRALFALGEGLVDAGHDLDVWSWWYDAPDKEKCADLGVFTRLPKPIASEAVEIVLEAALRARRTGLR